MKLLKIAVFGVSLLLAGAVSAGEEHQMKIRVVVADNDGGDEVHLNLDSADLGFNLHDMQEGETRSIVDESGRPILITRGAKGFKFDVDGKTIEMPLFDSEEGDLWVSDGGVENVEVHVLRDAEFVSGDDFDGVTILSSQPIDEVTRDGIKSLLSSSGHSGEVNFIDTSDGPHGPHGMHGIRVIKKEVVSEN
jgi:hypothetical protein